MPSKFELTSSSLQSSDKPTTEIGLSIRTVGGSEPCEELELDTDS